MTSLGEFGCLLRRKRRLVAGGVLGGVQRIGEARLRASRRERLLLARIGCPAREIDDLEARRDLARRASLWRSR